MVHQSLQLQLDLRYHASQTALLQQGLQALQPHHREQPASHTNAMIPMAICVTVPVVPEEELQYPQEETLRTLHAVAHADQGQSLRRLETNALRLYA